jgi:hypothetical protein
MPSENLNFAKSRDFGARELSMQIGWAFPLSGDEHPASADDRKIAAVLVAPVEKEYFGYHGKEQRICNGIQVALFLSGQMAIT